MGTAAGTGKRGDPRWSLGICRSQLYTQNSLGKFSERNHCFACEKGQVCVSTVAITHSQEPSEAPAPLSQALGRGVSSHSHLAPSFRVGSVVDTFRTFLPSPWWTNCVPCNLTTEASCWSPSLTRCAHGPFKKVKNMHLLCARHFVGHKYTYIYI